MASQDKKHHDIYEEPADTETPARMPIGHELASRPFHQFMDETRREAKETLAEWKACLVRDYFEPYSERPGPQGIDAYDPRVLWVAKMEGLDWCVRPTGGVRRWVR